MTIVSIVLLLVFYVGAASGWRSTKRCYPGARCLIAALIGVVWVAGVAGALLIIGAASDMVLN